LPAEQKQLDCKNKSSSVSDYRARRLLDMLRYLAALENAGANVFGEVSLSVEKYPDAVLR
jgi:hypothetical protein